MDIFKEFPILYTWQKLPVKHSARKPIMLQLINLIKSFMICRVLQVHNQSRRTCSLFSSIINIHIIIQVQRVCIYLQRTLSFCELYVRVCIITLCGCRSSCRAVYICPSDTCICTHVQVPLYTQAVYKILIYLYTRQYTTNRAPERYCEYNIIQVLRVGINVTFR